MNDEFIELAKGLMECYEKMYNLCYLEVERIINKRITNNKIIEHTLDQVLDIYTEKGFYLFIKLLLYYRTVNEENAYSYLQIFKEYRTEEYDEFVKKYTKNKWK